jgi:hypothetical protein
MFRYRRLQVCGQSANCRLSSHRSTLWPLTLHASYTSYSFRPPNHFSSHLNLTPSSPTKFRNRNPAHIMHLNIQLGRERGETNRGYISALCNWDLLSIQDGANCIAFLLLISVYSFDLTSIKNQRLLWCLKYRRCVWSLQKTVSSSSFREQS